MPVPAYKRAERVAHLIQQSLGELLVHHLTDPRVGFVTVTEVRLTDDLRHARVYVSIYGSDTERAASLEAIQESTPYLRKEIASRVQLRYTPALTFAHDNTLASAARLEQVVRAIHEGSTEVPDAAELVPVPVKTYQTDFPEMPLPEKPRGSRTKKSSRSGRGRRPRR